MLNGQLLMDRVAAAKLQNSRNREAERRENIFNHKQRTIGVDKEALDMQLKEKKLKEEAEKAKQMASDAEMLHNSKVACILTNKQQKQQRGIAKNIVTFREQYQQCSVFDLKNTHTEDSTMIIPGLVGEDPKSKDRQQRQREQLRDWLIQQQGERAAQRHRQKMEEQVYNQFMVEVNNKALKLQNLEEEKRKAAVIATKEYNLAMSEEKRRQDLEDTFGSMEEGQLTDVDTSQSIVGTADERREMQELKEFQKQQIEEKRGQELCERNVERYYDRVRVDSARTATLIERQQAKLNKQMRKHLDSTNLQLAETRKQLKPDISRGAINESFFSQFNTCSR